MFDVDHTSSASEGFPLRLFLMLFTPVALLILGGAWYVGQERIEEELALIQSSEISNVVMGVRRLDDELRVPLQHLRTLAGEASGNLEPRRLEAAFQKLIAYNGGYDKVRWIDATGRERVRVNNVEGKALAVAPEQLQALVDSYYVKESLTLKPGEVYISPLDLNVEHGKVETPTKAVLRLATPLRMRRVHRWGYWSSTLPRAPCSMPFQQPGRRTRSHDAAEQRRLLAETPGFRT